MKHVYFILFLFSAGRIFAQADAGKDKALCLGNAVTIGNMTDDTSYCYSWKAIPTDSSILNVKTAKITVSPSETTTYTLTVIGQDFQSISADEVKVIIIKEINLKTASFPGSYVIYKDIGGAYAEPYWAVDKQPAPVGFAGGSTMKLSALIDVDQDISTIDSIKIRGKGTDGYNIDPVIVSGNSNKIELSSTEVTKKFPSEVGYIDSFEMQWQVSFDGEKTWCDVGSSKNQLYVTLNQPRNPGNLFHTVLHIGCTKAKGETNNDNIFNNVWAYFVGKNVRRVDGTLLTYYKSYSTPNITTAQLLKEGDGQCLSWAKIFLDVLKSHGIDEDENYVYVTYKYGDGFFVKNWKFAETGTSGRTDYPYENSFPSINLSDNGYNWLFSDVSDLDGVAGQGNENPASLFINHQFVKYNGKFYDPSYGRDAVSIEEMENNSIEAYYIEGYLGVVYYIKRNPSTFDWNYQIFHY